MGATEVLCRDGCWREASQVHLSAGYGRLGGVVHALYASQPSLLIAAPEENGLDPHAADLVDFLRWIGVNAWPSEQVAQVPAAMRGLVLDALPDRVVVASDGYTAVLDKSELRWDSRLQATFRTVTGLDGILSSAPSDAILAWLALDPRWDPVNGTAFPAYVRARQGRAQFRPYEGALLDLVRAMVAGRPWLLATSGQKVAPRDAMAEPGRLEELFARPERPEQSAINDFGLDRAVWLRGLSNAGVPQRLGDLPERDIYRLLSSLERRKAGSELVRRLYLQVLELEGFDAARGGAEGRTFRLAGRLQVRRGATVACAAAPEVRYADRDGFPAAARELFALLDLPPRRNAREVAARFGVQPLSRQRVDVDLMRWVEAEAVQREMLAATMPFIKALRSAHSIDMGRLRRLARLVLVPVLEADLRFSIGGETVDGRLEPGRHLIRGDELVVAVDPAVPPEEFRLQAAMAMSDGLAELFELQSGDDFEKLLMADGPALRRLQMRRLLTHHSADEIERLMAQAEEDLASSEPEGHGVDAETFARATVGAGGTTNPGSGSNSAEAGPGAGTGGGTAASQGVQSGHGRPAGEGVEGRSGRPDGVRVSPLGSGSSSGGRVAVPVEDPRASGLAARPVCWAAPPT